MKLSKLIILILLVLGWVYPFHYVPWVVAENEFFILLIPCFLFFPLLKYKNTKMNEFIFLPLILLLFSFIQYFIIDYYFLEDFIVISIYALFIIFILICSQFYSSDENVYFFLKIIILLCLINSFIVLLQFFNIKSIFILEHSGVRRFYANVGQPNHLSTLFMTGIIATLILYRRQVIKTKMLYIMSIYLTFFIFLTGSRTGILTLLILLGLGFIFKIGECKTLNFYFFGILLLLYIAISYCFTKNSRNTVVSIETTFSDSRFLLWSDSISSILENPWLGYGVNGVRTSRLFGDLNFKIPYVSAHNIFIDFFLWFGVVGGILFLVYLLIVFKRIYTDKNNGYEILLFLTPFTVHSLFEYPFRYLYFLVLIVPAFTLIKGKKQFYIHRSILILMISAYIGLVSFVYIDFERYSRGAFFAHTQKCESGNGDPIVLDLMKKYSQLYCGTLSSFEMRKVIYRYAYPIHIKYYIESGYDDENFIRFEQKIKSDNQIK